MSKEIPEAIYGSPNSPLKIGNAEIPCYVLEDGRRVLVQGGMLAALNISPGGSGGSGGDRLAKFVSTKAINPFVNKGLADRIKNPIIFRITKGNMAYGYEATILADLCDAVLASRKAGFLLIYLCLSSFPSIVFFIQLFQFSQEVDLSSSI